jgi:hypothetical protein
MAQKKSANLFFNTIAAQKSKKTGVCTKYFLNDDWFFVLIKVPSFGIINEKIS